MIKKNSKMKMLVIIGILAFAGAGIFGCSAVQVRRADADKEIALTDKWNDEDSRLVAQEMVDDMFTFPWMKKFKKNHPDKDPTIIIQRITNKSHEHIAVDTFTNDIKRAIQRSGLAEFVVGGAERERIRRERMDQQAHSSEESAKDLGEEMGADFALSGTINSMVDQLGNKRVTYYQIDMKLINMQTNREAWNGQKKIKKVQKRSAFGF